MSNIKLTPERMELAKIFIKLKIPNVIIAKILRVNTLTIFKKLRNTIAAMKESAPTEIRNETRIELLKLYAWIKTDEKDFIMSFQINEVDMKMMSKAIYDYLWLNKFEAYCDGYIEHAKILSKIEFAPEILDYEKDLIRMFLEEEPRLQDFTGKILFEACLCYMHREDIYPKADFVFRPSIILEKALGKSEFNQLRQKGVFIPKKFADLIFRKIQADCESRHAGAIVFCKKNDLIGKIYDYKDDTQFVEKYTDYTVLQKSRKYFSGSLLPLVRSISRINKSKEFYPDDYNGLIENIVNLHNQNKATQINLIEGEFFIKNLQNAFNLLANDYFKSVSLPTDSAKNVVIDYSNDTKLLEEIKTTKQEIPGKDQYGYSEKQINFLCSRIRDLDLSVRAMNCLLAADFEYAWEVALSGTDELLKFRNFGRKSLTEIENMYKGANGIKIPENFSPTFKRWLEEQTTLKYEAK